MVCRMDNTMNKFKIQRNIAIIIAIVAILFIRRCDSSSSNDNTMKQNLFALQDTIRSYKDKNGNLIYEKGALISENGDLKGLNKDLYDEIKDLKDKPLVAIKTVFKVKHDTLTIPIFVNNSVHLNDGSVKRDLNWNYEKTFTVNNYRKLSGKFSVTIDSLKNLYTDSMHITTDEIGMSFTTGLTENGEYLEIFVKSSYPGFKPIDMRGSLIDPKKSEVLQKYFKPKKWSFGIYGGYGVYFNPKSFDIGNGVQLGVGVQYNFLQWNFKN